MHLILLSLVEFYVNIFRYNADFDLKKVVDESSMSSEARVETRKNVKKLFEEKYRTQTGKNEKKAGGAQYFFKKLRF